MTPIRQRSNWLLKATTQTHRDCSAAYSRRLGHVTASALEFSRASSETEAACDASASSGLSPTPDEALSPDVGGSEQRTMRRIHARQGCSRVHHERPDDADLVAEPSERFHD